MRIHSLAYVICIGIVFITSLACAPPSQAPPLEVRPTKLKLIFEDGKTLPENTDIEIHTIEGNFNKFTRVRLDLIPTMAGETDTLGPDGTSIQQYPKTTSSNPVYYFIYAVLPNGKVFASFTESKPKSEPEPRSEKKVEDPIYTSLSGSPIRMMKTSELNGWSQEIDNRLKTRYTPTQEFLKIRHANAELFPEGTLLRIIERDASNAKTLQGSNVLPATEEEWRVFDARALHEDQVGPRGLTEKTYPTTVHADKTYLVYAMMPYSDVLYVSVNNNDKPAAPLFDPLYSGNFTLIPAHELPDYALESPGYQQEKAASIQRVKANLFPEPEKAPLFPITLPVTDPTLLWTVGFGGLLFITVVGAIVFALSRRRRRNSGPTQEGFQMPEPAEPEPEIQPAVSIPVADPIYPVVKQEIAPPEMVVPPEMVAPPERITPQESIAPPEVVIPPVEEEGSIEPPEVISEPDEDEVDHGQEEEKFMDITSQENYRRLLEEFDQEKARLEQALKEKDALLEEKDTALNRSKKKLSNQGELLEKALHRVTKLMNRVTQLEHELQTYREMVLDDVQPSTAEATATSSESRSTYSGNGNGHVPNTESDSVATATVAAPRPPSKPVEDIVAEVYIAWCRSDNHMLGRLKSFGSGLEKKLPGVVVTTVYKARAYGRAIEFCIEKPHSSAKDYWMINIDGKHLVLPKPMSPDNFKDYTQVYEGNVNHPRNLETLQPALVSEWSDRPGVFELNKMGTLG